MFVDTIASFLTNPTGAFFSFHLDMATLVIECTYAGAKRSVVIPLIPLFGDKAMVKKMIQNASISCVNHTFTLKLGDLKVEFTQYVDDAEECEDGFYEMPDGTRSCKPSNGDHFTVSVICGHLAEMLHGYAPRFTAYKLERKFKFFQEEMRKY